MLSILIPVYNVKVDQLVASLNDQCTRQEITYEIICLDDGSNERLRDYHKAHLTGEHIVYDEVKQNLGRSSIRNTLARQAQYPFLLFLDGDQAITRPDFIQLYLKAIKSHPQAVLCGGTIYSQDPPKDRSYVLHWHYGKYREEVPAYVRFQSPQRHFHSNNFLIAKDLFIDIRFDTTIKGYGYEDLELGHRLTQLHKKIVHIENPVLHLGLKPSYKFLADLKSASANLSFLYAQNKIGDTPLILWYNRIKIFRLWKPLILVFRAQEQRMLQWFESQHRPLLLLDALKLLYFAQGQQNDK